MDINNYFNSEEFWNIVENYINIPINNEFGNSYEEGYYKDRVEEAMSYIIEESIKFYLLFKEEKNIKVILSDYITNIIPIINGLNQSTIYDNCDTLMLHYLYRLEGINNPQNLTEEEKNICFEKIYQNIIENNYAFHAFNSANYNSIKNNGINPAYSITKQEEINLINDLFIKYGLKTPFFMQQNNCVGKISYSLSPNVSYGYGIDSPEWFSNFCHIGGEAISPFSNRNYEAAFNNIMKKIELFSDVDKKTVLDFFNKNWKIYASNENIPILSIIPRKKTTDKENERIEFCEDVNFYFDYSCLERDMCDSHTDFLDTSNAMFITMPSYNRLMKLAEYKYAEQINNTKSKSL